MKKVLVMGGSYFIGKRIIDQLLLEEYSVFTLNRGSRANADPRIHSLICDRNNPTLMQEVLKGYEFDIVIDVSGLDKLQGEILYQSLKVDKLQKFVFISSSAVYDIENIDTPFNESDPVKENIYWTSYGQNKIEAELFYKERFQDSDTNLIILRPPYVYGENNYAQRESFIFEHILNNKPVIIPNTNPKLQFIYTADLANIITTLLNTHLPSVAVFNVGNKLPVTAREWVEHCAKVVGKEAKIIEYDYKKSNRRIREFFPFSDYDNILDVSQINEIYNEETKFEQGLQNAYKWFLENKDTLVFKDNVTKNELAILRELGITD